PRRNRLAAGGRSDFGPGHFIPSDRLRRARLQLPLGGRARHAHGPAPTARRARDRQFLLGGGVGAHLSRLRRGAPGATIGAGDRFGAAPPAVAKHRRIGAADRADQRPRPARASPGDPGFSGAAPRGQRRAGSPGALSRERLRNSPAGGENGDHLVSFARGSHGQNRLSQMEPRLPVSAAGFALRMRLEPESETVDQKTGGAVAPRNRDQPARALGQAARSGASLAREHRQHRRPRARAREGLRQTRARGTGRSRRRAPALFSRRRSGLGAGRRRARACVAAFAGGPHGLRAFDREQAENRAGQNDFAGKSPGARQAPSGHDGAGKRADHRAPMRRSLQRNQRRIAVAKMFFLLLLVAVGARAVQLQMLQGEKLMKLGQRQHLKEWIVLPKRGALFDRGGEPLALSMESHSVYARPHRVDNPEPLSRALAQILNLRAGEVKQKLASDKPFVWIKRQVSSAEAEKIQTLNADGIGMFYEPNRYYPQGQLAGQLIGFVGRDSEGLEGLELKYNDYIRGETGSSVTERDALGQRVLVQGVEDLRIPHGSDMYLTIDTSIQYAAEKELEAAIAKYRAKAGVAIVADPFTGEILALANYPSFDPNNYARESPGQRRDRAVTDSFEPGSTFKTILAAAALEEGVVGKDDLFYCEMGKYPYAGKIIHDTHPNGWLSFSKILQVSSNIGFTKVAEKLKKDRYYKYIEKFGFGHETGIDLPGEVAGLVRKPESWSAIDLATH